VRKYSYEVWLEHPGKPKELKIVCALDMALAMAAAQDLLAKPENARAGVWIAVKPMVDSFAVSPEAQNALREAGERARQAAGRAVYGKLRLVKDE
jgi:hypothetical protein